MNLRLLTLFASVALGLASTASAQDRDDLHDRYTSLTRCMERVLGSGWDKRYGIALQTNRWGSEEPNQHDIDSAPQAVRMVDLRCRRELQLSGQPRP